MRPILLALTLLLQPPAVRFPTITSATLEGRTLTLPGDFAGSRNVVFVAFLREQQADVDTWVPAVKQFMARTPGLEYYEFPTIKPMVGAMRWMINRGMKAGIADKGARERTATLFVDKAPFKQALGIPDEREIQVLLVTRSGDVLWRTTGRFTPEKGAALAAALTTR